jgi:osmoprotectant transport system ATP-binding protein
VLEIREVTKSYKDKAGKEVVILHPTSQTIEAGKTAVLIGPSGCGKSTLLKLIVGLAAPDSGGVWIGDTQMTPANALELRKSIGYVIQDGGLFPHMSARDNVSLVARFLGWDTARCDARICELADLVRLDAGLLGRFPSQMSGGQRQRVGIMRALMLDPPVLLLDEPMGALDPLVRAKLQDDLRKIFHEHEKVVVMVTHDLGEAGFFAEKAGRILLLGGGRVIQSGTIDDLIHRPANGFVEEFVKAHRIPGVSS